jgi:hypothetical protein
MGPAGIFLAICHDFVPECASNGQFLGKALLPPHSLSGRINAGQICFFGRVSYEIGCHPPACVMKIAAIDEAEQAASPSWFRKEALADVASENS